MKNLRALLGMLAVILGLATLPGPAQSQSRPMFVGYDSFCGIKTYITNTGRGAVATHDAYGRPVIYVDPEVAANWTESRMFVVAHECAHHKLGHVSVRSGERYTPWGTQAQELEADCWAAKKLYRLGHRFDIERTIRSHASKGHYTDGGYPSGVQRAQNVMNCVGLAAIEDGPRCHYEDVPESYISYEVVNRPYPGPCQHCQYTPYGVSCLHASDPYDNLVQVPVERVRMKRVQICR